jgi:hypothetical protein
VFVVLHILFLIQSSAYHSGKIKVGDKIIKVFDKDVKDFSFITWASGRRAGIGLLFHGNINLTLVRERRRCDKAPLGPVFCNPLDSPRGNHDFVIVGGDGKELPAHKVVLSGWYSIFFFRDALIIAFTLNLN